MSNRIFKTFIHRKIKEKDFIGQSRYLYINGKDMTFTWTKDKQLYINCNNGNYILDWDGAGSSWAVPVIFIETKLLGFIPARKLIFEGDEKPYITAQNSLKDELESWYLKTLIKYTDYCESWDIKQ